MGHRYKSLAAALVLLAAVFDSHAAGVTIPNTFTPGTPARAADVNANFSAVSSAVNGIDTRLSSVEAQLPASTTLTITQTSLTVGSTVVVGGTTYLIVQMEVPQFGTDTVYLFRWPVVQSDFNSGRSVYIRADGSFSPQNPWPSCSTYNKTTLSGFPAVLCDNDFSFYAYFERPYTSGGYSGRQVTNTYYQTAYVNVDLDSYTRIWLNLDLPNLTNTGSSTISSADGTSLTTVYPPTPNAAARETRRQLLRTLASYISISKKP